MPQHGRTPAEAMPRWLVIVPQIPQPDRASGDRRLAAMLEVLSKRCRLSVASLSERPDDAEPYEAALRMLGIEILGYSSWSAIRAMIRYEFDTIFFEFYGSAHGLLHFVDTLQPSARTIVDSVDLHYMRAQSAALTSAAVPHDALALKASELAVYRRADFTLVVTESEREELRREGMNQCLVVPNIVPVVPRLVRERAPEVLFIGGFRHPPNAVAVRWFAADIWPLIRRAEPSATWTIAGSDTPDEILAMDGRNGVRVAGFVPSTAPLLDSTQVSVAPLTFGAGMKGKVSEALAAGVPVVTTSWGAQGLESGAGSAFLLADSAHAFADAVILVLSDEGVRASLSHNGQRLAELRCSSDAAGPVLEALMERHARSVRTRSVARRIAAFVQLVVRRRLAKLRRGAHLASDSGVAG